MSGADFGPQLALLLDTTKVAVLGWAESFAQKEKPRRLLHGISMRCSTLAMTGDKAIVLPPIGGPICKD
jgi:hypothetical protein